MLVCYTIRWNQIIKVLSIILCVLILYIDFMLLYYFFIFFYKCICEIFYVNKIIYIYIYIQDSIHGEGQYIYFEEIPFLWKISEGVLWFSQFREKMTLLDEYVSESINLPADLTSIILKLSRLEESTYCILANKLIVWRHLEKCQFFHNLPNYKASQNFCYIYGCIMTLSLVKFQDIKYYAFHKRMSSCSKREKIPYLTQLQKQDKLI